MSLYIPKKIKIGFQKRGGTFTGKLAYVVYFDDKGVLRKENSWESWRDSSIEPIEFDNTPKNGFLFNKGIRRDGYHWGSGRSVIRVYDPRDFEFEITVDNLIGILMHSDVSKRDIVEECLYAWEGKDLVLLPVNSDVYEKSIKYTEKQSQNLSAKSLVKGRAYNLKKNDGIWTYIGYYEWYDWKRLGNSYYDKNHSLVGKKHIFFDGKYYVTPGMSVFSSVASEEVDKNYPELVENFFKTINSQPIKSLVVDPNYDACFYNIRGNIVERCAIGKTFGNYLSFDYIEVNIHENKTTTIIRDRYRNDYYYRTKPPTTFLKTAKMLGYDPDNLSSNNFVSILEKEQYQRGSLCFVLENGELVHTAL